MRCFVMLALSLVMSLPSTSLQVRSYSALRSVEENVILPAGLYAGLIRLMQLHHVAVPDNIESEVCG